MKKLTAIAITGILALTVGVTAFAASESTNAPAKQPPQRQEIQLTEAQKADLAKIREQMTALQKQRLSVLVEAGAITQEQADKMSAHMDNRSKDGILGMGGKGRGMGPRGGCQGPQQPVNQ